MGSNPTGRAYLSFGKTGIRSRPETGYVVNPDGRFLPPEAYNPKAWLVLVVAPRGSVGAKVNRLPRTRPSS